MAPADLDDRLSRIATRWTTVFRAHAATATGVVGRYVMGLVRA